VSKQIYTVNYMKFCILSLLLYLLLICDKFNPVGLVW